MTIPHKYDHLIDRIKELHDEGISWRQVAKRFSEENPELTNSTSIKALGQTLKSRYLALGHTALRDEITTPHHVPFGQVKHYWDKTKNVSAFIKIAPEDQINIEERIENIVSSFVKETKAFKVYKEDSERCLIGTVTDEHVGMNPNPNGKALFQYEYNADIYQSKVEQYFNSLVHQRDIYGTFEVLELDNLGDREDGWNGQTTRGGHELEQNMTVEEVFEACVETKLRLVENCIKEGIARRYLLVDVSNDNHSGSFGRLINMTVAKIINRVYSSEIVETKILTRFMDNVIYGNHTFIKTHGKDEKYMKSGLPFVLNDKTIRFINEYIEHYNLKGFIHLDKGDLHQKGYKRYKKFDYNNFMSFAPPSNWQQHNFGDSYAGYTLRVVDKWKNEIEETNRFIDYKKVIV